MATRPSATSPNIPQWVYVWVSSKAGEDRHEGPAYRPKPRPSSRGTRPAARLPRWDRVLAVVAHPDDESFGLGAVLAAMVGEGAEVGVLCLTHGEASTLHGVDGDLRAVREGELAEAAGGCSAHGGRGCSTTPTAR